MKANDEVDHHLRPVGAATDWRRSRSESSGAVDDLETSYVPAAACLPGPHRRHYVNISNHFLGFFFFFFIYYYYYNYYYNSPLTCQHPVSFSLCHIFIRRFSVDPLASSQTPFGIRPHLFFLFSFHNELYFLFIF